MNKISLVAHIRKLALGWAVGGSVLTASLSASLFIILKYKDAERELSTMISSTLFSYRTDILSGDVRGIQLQLNREYSIGEGEILLFLDPNKKPWLEDWGKTQIELCPAANGICPNIRLGKLTSDFPIYFDSEKKTLWGYLHVERHPRTNWSLVLSVILAIVLGMFFQALGFYFNIVKSIRVVGSTLGDWANRLSANPKNSLSYDAAPYLEIEPIERALSGLKSEIDALENLAREQGSLNTLRGIGHDILNPVARIKRIVGILQMKNLVDSDDKELFENLISNLKRLSSYAEQLKLLYKRRIGETSGDIVEVLDISSELKKIAVDLAHDPEAMDKRIQFKYEIENNCHARIPLPVFGRLVENLIGNSIQASDENGQITLQVSRSGKDILISIADMGVGIPEELQSKIFQPDFTTRGNKGTGLGLFVVKQLCEQYDGTVSMSSAKGKGTIFGLRFPFELRIRELVDGILV
jgi:signal transduction histidine kinase